MQRSEEQTAGGCGRNRAFEPTEQPVHRHGLQGHLLQNAEGEVVDESPRIKEKSGSSTERAKRSADADQPGGKQQENGSGAARCGPEVVGAPAECAGRVAVQSKAQNHPSGENDPGLRPRRLQPPYVERYKSSEGERFCKICEGDEHPVRLAFT